MSERVLVALALALVGACAGCSDETKGVAQGPITFVLTNNSGSARYGSWSDGRPLAFELEVEQGGGWVSVAFNQPGCSSRCSEVEVGSECALACGPSFRGIRRIDNGGSVKLIWQGKVYPIVDDHCSDTTCYLTENPKAARYRLTACVYDGFTCDQTGCTPDDKTTTFGEVSGAKTCASAELSLPYADNTVDVSID